MGGWARRVVVGWCAANCTAAHVQAVLGRLADASLPPLPVAISSCRSHQLRPVPDAHAGLLCREAPSHCGVPGECSPTTVQNRAEKALGASATPPAARQCGVLPSKLCCASPPHLQPEPFWVVRPRATKAGHALNVSVVLVQPAPRLGWASGWVGGQKGHTPKRFILPAVRPSLIPPQLEWGRGRVFDAEVGAMFQRLVVEAKQVRRGRGAWQW